MGQMMPIGYSLPLLHSSGSHTFKPLKITEDFPRDFVYENYIY